MQKIRQWLIDTYNGIYVIVLKPYMPSYQTVLVVVLAVLFGLFWGYVLRPVEFYNAAPFRLTEEYREEWIKQVAGAYEAGLYQNDQEAINYLAEVENPGGVVERLLTETDGSLQAALQQILPLAQQANPGTPAPNPNDLVRSILDIVLAVVVAVIATLIIAPVWSLLIKPNLIDPLRKRFQPKTDADREAEANLRRIRETREREEQMRRDSAAAAVTNPYGKPVMQRLSVYTKGRQYDDSFAIEDANDVFLGECGATIAKTVGDNELAAVEVWLFDKEDFVRTLTKIFVSQAGYNDPSVRAEIDSRVDDPATDIIVVTPGAKLTLETDALMVQATISEVTYNSGGALPPNSYFESLTLQVEAWEKRAAGASVAAPASAAAASPPTYAPPPAYNPPPTYAPPPPTSVPPSYTPPQPTQPRTPPPDDDPFGGTGDFTPVGR